MMKNNLRVLSGETTFSRLSKITEQPSCFPVPKPKARRSSATKHSIYTCSVIVVNTRVVLRETIITSDNNGLSAHKAAKSVGGEERKRKTMML